jgi:signal transduction histidine kinase
VTVDQSAELVRLRAMVRDLLAISTIPQAWVGREALAIAGGLADVLIDSLNLDVVFVRLRNPTEGDAIEVTRGDSEQPFPDWLRTLADDRLNVQAAREAATMLVKDAVRADENIRRTTAFYKKDTIQREPVDLNAMIRKMAVLSHQEARASSISLQTRLVDGTPQVMAGRVQLQQVFMNLMLNAIDAMTGTGGELTITSQMKDGSELLIGVSDTGVGLPTDDPEQIFESFVTTKPHGTGMGLTITRSIVESHGGRLWATANAGPGATFLFTLLTEAGEQLPSPSRAERAEGR